LSLIVSLNFILFFFFLQDSTFILLASTIHLTVLQGSNITLQCAEKGMWIIEESHRGGPVRKLFCLSIFRINLLI